MWYRNRLKTAAFDGFGGEDAAQDMAGAIQDFHNEVPPKFEGDEDARLYARMEYNQNIKNPALIQRLEVILNARGNFATPIKVELNNVHGDIAAYNQLDHTLSLSQRALYLPEQELIDVCEHEFSHAKEFDYANRYKIPGRQNRVDQAHWDRMYNNGDEFDKLHRAEYQRLQEEGYYDPEDPYDPYASYSHDSDVDYYNTPTEVTAYASNIKNEIKRLPEAARKEVMAAGTNFQTFVAALQKYSPTFQKASPNLLKESLRQMVLVVYNALFNPRR